MNEEGEEVAKKKPVKPLPQRLSDWNSGKEVIYICPECLASFAFYGEKQNYCHICGAQLDWSNCPKYVSDEFKALWDEESRKYYNSAGKVSFEDYSKATTDLLWKLHIGELK